MANKRSVLNYVLHINGVFGRNRKAKVTSFRLAKYVDPSTPKTLEELLPAMRQKLVEIKCKPGCKIRLTEDPIELEDINDSYTSECFVLFSERLMYSEVLT